MTPCGHPRRYPKICIRRERHRVESVLSSRIGISYCAAYPSCALRKYGTPCQQKVFGDLHRVCRKRLRASYRVAPSGANIGTYLVLSVVRNRGSSPFRLPQGEVGFHIIAPRRNRSAHLHRPWRAIYATAKASLACAASSRILAATPRRFGSQPKISKTTPCKVAAVAGKDALGQYLTRRANQWHSFIIAQSMPV